MSNCQRQANNLAGQVNISSLVKQYSKVMKGKSFKSSQTRMNIGVCKALIRFFFFFFYLLTGSPQNFINVNHRGKLWSQIICDLSAQG